MVEQTNINELNTILEIKQDEFNYRFIRNENIMPALHLWRDKVHLGTIQGSESSGQ